MRVQRAIAAAALLTAAGCPGPIVEDDVNRAPVFEPLEGLTVLLGDSLVVVVPCKDPDGDAITLAVVEGPAGASFEADVLVWTPGADDVGTHTFILEATDDGEPPLSSTQVIPVRVLRAPPFDPLHLPAAAGLVLPPLTPPVNHAPVLTDLPPLQVWPCVPLSLVFAAIDPDGDRLFWQAEHLPAGATFTPAGTTAVLAWTPGQDDLGAHTMSIHVRDDGNPSLMDGTLVMLYVWPPPPPAVICRDEP